MGKNPKNKRARAAEPISAELYGRLRKLARSYFRNERKNHTLAPTALVHEAYLRWVKEAPSPQSNQIPLGFKLARLMRQVLIQHAVAMNSQKRGGGRARVTFVESDIPAVGNEPQFDLLELDDALDRLERQKPRLAKLVELRFFAGLTIEETAKHLNISVATAKRDWAFAKVWIQNEIETKTKAA